MSDVKETKQADEARSKLVSDIQELKETGQQIVRQTKSKLPWLIGGAVGLLAIGAVFAGKPSRRLARPRPSLLGKAARAAALSAVGILTRHFVTKAMNKALPEPEPARVRAAA